MKVVRLFLFRMLGMAPFLFLLPLLTFFLMSLVPGNYFDSLKMNPQIPPQVIEEYAREYRLNDPVFFQYGAWLMRLLKLDFGYSFSYRQPVMDLLMDRARNTLILTIPSFFLAWILAFGAGLWAGMRRGSWGDRALLGLSSLLIATPSFFLCLVFLRIGFHFPGFPLGGMMSAHAEEFSFFEKVTDLVSHMLIPVAVMTLSSFGMLFRVFRTQVDAVMEKDFIFFLHASGIKDPKIFLKHIARNALNPLVTLFGLELPFLLSGAAMVEIFTGWPGLGALMLQAVRAQDLFLVLGNMVILSLGVALGALLSDGLLMLLDPRIRAEARA